MAHHVFGWGPTAQTFSVIEEVRKSLVFYRLGHGDSLNPDSGGPIALELEHKEEKKLIKQTLMDQEDHERVHNRGMHVVRLSGSCQVQASDS